MYYAVKKLQVAYPRGVTGHYFYSQENHLMDMASSRLYYDLNKHTSDRNSILELHLASWAITAIGHLTRVNIYGIIK
jgi:hypothetical protein